MAEFRCSGPPSLRRRRSNNRYDNTPYAPFVAPPSDAAPPPRPYYTPVVGRSFDSPPRLHHRTPYDRPVIGSSNVIRLIHHSFVYDCPRRYPSYAPSYDARPSYPSAAAPSSGGPPRLHRCTKPDFPSNRKAMVNTDALLPHQILALALNSHYTHNEEHAVMAERSWDRTVSALRSMGKLRNSIAVYYLSTNMSETAKQVSIAMALMISELSQPPWRGKVLNFNQDPRLLDIQGNSIVDKAKFLRDYVECSSPEYYLDYEMVFKQILKVAENAKLKQDEMIKRVFLFTDRSFPDSSYYRAKVYEAECGWAGDSWKHDEYPMLRSMFSEAGYAMPKIVFWDLHQRFTDIPWVCSDTEPFTGIPWLRSDTLCLDAEEVPRMPEGVTQLVGGMSDHLLKLFIKKDAVLTKNDFIAARGNHIVPILEQ